ncbi:MAG: polynucleotide adenylyltransferase, partial [Actinomycetia bacterium]|nr:polynucleotide adenylyltransferase [Actinomycetes bacterium]
MSAVDRVSLVLPDQALRALAVLEEAGFEAWCVGGFVRDTLMDRPIKDIDIASTARWEQARSAFEEAGYQTFETGTQHGTITVKVDAMLFEVTTYRIDGSYSDRRRPDSVEFVTSIEEDLARRDFTINAIAYHPTRGFCDPYQGRADIANRIIKAVGDPAQRFNEDALRILRAVRFASQLGFSLEPVTRQALDEYKTLLDAIAVERVRDELDGIFRGDAIGEVLIEFGDIIAQVIPEIAPMSGFDQKNPYHAFD